MGNTVNTVSLKCDCTEEDRHDSAELQHLYNIMVTNVKCIDDDTHSSLTRDQKWDVYHREEHRHHDDGMVTQIDCSKQPC